MLASLGSGLFPNFYATLIEASSHHSVLSQNRMASIEAVYMADINGRLLLDYPIGTSQPDPQEVLERVFPLVSSGPLELDPVIEFSSDINIHCQQHGNVVFLLPCTSKTPSLLPVEFISRMIEIFEDYLGSPLLPIKLESNYDTVVLILNEMIDGGYPYMTSGDIIKDLVPYGGLLRKLLTGSNVTQQVSDIPWRRANVRHTNNELFIDIVESIYSIIPGGNEGGSSSSTSAFYSSTNGASLGLGFTTQPVINRVEGNIFATSNLSGVPEIQLRLGLAGHKIEYPSFHQCIDIPTWVNSPGNLKFIPPDGKTLVMSYTLEDVGTKNCIVFASLKTGLGMQKNEFEARVWTVISRNVKSVDGLSIKLACGKNAKSIQNLRITAGDFHMADGGIGEWTFSGKTALGWSATLRGTLVVATKDEEDEESGEEEADSKSSASSSLEATGAIFPKYMSLKYSVTGTVYSGISVDLLKINSLGGISDSVKPYKGVRYLTNTGEFIVRR